MVAGRGLLPLLLCHALSYLTLAHSLLPPFRTISSTVRIRRSGSFFDFPYVSNSSSSSSSSASSKSSVVFGDLMLEDEAIEAKGSIQEKLVVRGQVVVLQCLERDKNVPPHKNKIKETHTDAAVRWFHDEEEVKPGLRVTWAVTGRLEITHAVSGDSGVWRCRKDGYFRRPLRLIVTIPPERPFLVYGAAQLAEGARLTTRAGNPLSLHCVVEGGNPAPTIEWFLNEKEITSNSSTRNEWRGADVQFASVSNVTIAKVSKGHHNASVVCRVVHPALSRPHTSHLKLNIEYPPDFRLLRWPGWGSPLREGAAASLLCHVDANPPSSPLWIKEADGKEKEIASVEGWLNLTSVTPSSRGWYKCATNHPFGKFSSHSVYINVLQDGPITQQYPLRQRENVQPTHIDDQAINCPPSTDITSDTSHKYIWKSDIKIKVMNRTHAALEGGPAMLTAHVCGTPVSPDHVTWLPPSKLTPLMPGKSYGRWTAFNLSSPDSQKCVLSNLHIVPVSSLTDAGPWIILVANSHSAHAAIVQLNVSTAAKSLAAAAASDSTSAGANIIRVSVFLQSGIVMWFLCVILG